MAARLLSFDELREAAKDLGGDHGSRAPWSPAQLETHLLRRSTTKAWFALSSDERAQIFVTYAMAAAVARRWKTLNPTREVEHA